MKPLPSYTTNNPAGAIASNSLITRLLKLTRTGIVLADENSNIVLSNPSAKKFIYTRAKNIGQAFTHPTWLEQAPKLIQTALTASQNGQELNQHLVLPRQPKKNTLLISICSLANPYPQEHEAVMAVLIEGAQRNQAAPVKTLNTLFGLTPSEARIAWAFSQGLKVSEIARTFNIAPTTVAFHKRNIFQKTQTHRQADLIALLLTLPVQTDE